MILLFLTIQYLYDTASTAPTNATFQAADVPVVVNGANYRSTAQIVTSCMSTVLLCTWFTIHPDVCGPGSTLKERVGRKVELFLWALLMPESVMTWACNQWLGARQICEVFPSKMITVFTNKPILTCLYREYGRSLTEAHFLQMGGLLIYDERKQKLDPFRYLEDLEDLDGLHQAIGLEEIEDLSKRDTLSKAIVLVQTTWFTDRKSVV